MRKVLALAVAIAVLGLFAFLWTQQHAADSTPAPEVLRESPDPSNDATAGAPGSLAARTSASRGTDEPTPARLQARNPDRNEDRLREQAAREFVESLTHTGETAIPVNAADHFVSSDQTLRFDSGRVVEEVSLRELRREAALSPSSLITVVKKIEQVELATPAKLIADSGGDLDRSIRVLLNDKVQEMSVRRALSAHATKPDQPLSVVKTVEYLEPTTVRALISGLFDKSDAADAASVGLDRLIRVIRKPYRLESTTVAELLAGMRALDPDGEDAVFYVHSVNPEDTQGVWGIIHHGLISNFARGMAIGRGEDLDTYKVVIPRDADERNPDNSSSFLGRLIDRKAEASAVYNFRIGRMTQNAHLVVPGSEIVIVSFRPNELVEIYKHFLSRPAGTG